MKRSILLIFLCSLLTTKANSQDSLNSDRYLKNLVFSIGAGVFPYGTETIANQHIHKYFGDPSAKFSTKLGLAYTSPDLPFGVFVDASLGEHYYDSRPVPFSLSNTLIRLEVTDLKKIDYLRVKSNSINFGIMIGKEFANDFEVYAKMGIGHTSHDFELTVTENSTNKRAGGNFKATSTNYQVCTEFRYFPLKYTGFGSSIGISDNFPVFSMAVFFRLNRFSNLKKSNRKS